MQLSDQNGILLVDKAADWSSHDVVKFIRRFGIKKVGHAGTLDPMATGLLVILVGRGTKLSNQLSGSSKIYESRLCLGIETDSQDAVGSVVKEQEVGQFDEDEIRSVFDSFNGDIEQIPPMYSALKRDGKKLYDLARKGITIEREARPVTIHELAVNRIELPYINFTVHCSKGTYVRTLCHDIGKTLGCGGHMASLRRTASGSFSIADAHPVESIKKWSKEALSDAIIKLEDLEL